MPDIAAKTDGEWIKCGKCGAKWCKILEFGHLGKGGKPNLVQFKCKSKHSSETCNSFNQVLL